MLCKEGINESSMERKSHSSADMGLDGEWDVLGLWSSVEAASETRLQNSSERKAK